MIGGGPQKITVEIGGKIAASLGASLRSAQTQVSSFGRNVTRTMNDAAISGKKSFKGVFDNALWQQATIGVTAFAGAIVLSTKAAMEFDNAMADVRKAIDFRDGSAGLKQFSNKLVQLSGELPYTAAELSKIAASAGFAGYAENEIIPFTRAAARMGIAFQMTAEQAGEAMVALRASMGLTQPQVEKLGDAINHLSDRFQGTVNAADLTEVTRRIGAIGKSAGLTAEEVAGMGAAFLASGTPAEVAATGLKNFLNALTKGESISEKQGIAMATLFGPEGMVEMIRKGKGKVKKAAKEEANDISVAVAKQMQIDPEGTIKSVLDRIAKLPKHQAVSIAGDLFGEESKQAIMPLLTNTKLIGQGFDLIRKESAFAGSMQKEFQNQMATSGAQVKIFSNGINALGISIGSALLPSLNGIMKAIVPVLVGLSKFAQENQTLTTGIVLIGGALAGLVIALPIIAGVVSAIGTLKTALVAVNLGGLIAGWLPALASFGVAAGAAMLPLLPWVALIAGIGVGIFALVKHWDVVKAAAISAWQSISKEALATWEGTKREWGQFTGWIGGLFNQALGIIRAWGPKVLAVMFPIPALIINLFTNAGIGQKIITSIIDGLKARASALFSWVSGAVSRIRSMVGGGSGGDGAAPAPAAPPGRANGGRVLAGMGYIVGERRRELFVPGMDGAIIPRIAQPISVTPGAKTTPSVNLRIPAQAAAPPARSGVTIHAPVTIHASGDTNNIREQVRLAFEDLIARAYGDYRVALND